MSDKDGGPAFGGSWDTVYFDTKGRIEPQRMERRAPGMSLRDYFAAQALQAVIREIGSASVKEVADGIRAGGTESKTAYAYADAMLKERAK